MVPLVQIDVPLCPYRCHTLPYSRHILAISQDMCVEHPTLSHAAHVAVYVGHPTLSHAAHVAPYVGCPTLSHASNVALYVGHPTHSHSSHMAPYVGRPTHSLASHMAPYVGCPTASHDVGSCQDAVGRGSTLVHFNVPPTVSHGLPTAVGKIL